MERSPPAPDAALALERLRLLREQDDLELGELREETDRALERISESMVALADWARRSSRESALTTEQLGRSLAHELRNRLGAAETSLRFLSAGAAPVSDDRRDRVLEIVEGSLESARESVKMLASVGSEDESRLDLVAFDVVARRTLEQLRPLAEGAAVELRVEDLPQPRIERHLGRLAVSNLIANAVKYHDPEKSERWVELSARVEGDLLEITIRDNGLGIPADRLGDIFRPAVQINRRAAGWGMGLALVSKALDAAGGSIRVDSTPGSGSTFTLEMPIPTEEISDG